MAVSRTFEPRCSDNQSPGYYPNLIALYTKLGVAFRQADFSYSFSLFNQAEKTQPLRTTMIYNGASGRDGVGMPAWMQDLHLYQKGHRLVTRAFGLGLFILSAVQLFVCYMRLIFLALPAVRSKRHNAMTFEEWTAATVPSNFVARILRLDTVWKSFTQDVLIPLFSAVCTAPKELVNAHPAEDFLGELSRINSEQNLTVFRLYLAHIWNTPLRGRQRGARRCCALDIEREAYPSVVTFNGHPCRP